MTCFDGLKYNTPMSTSDLIYHRHEIFNESDKNVNDSLYINFLRALALLVNNVYYIFDYSRNKLIYPHSIMQFLEHKISLQNQGYAFYERCVHPTDHPTIYGQSSLIPSVY